MSLIRQPFRPPYSFLRTFYPYLEQQVEWRKFIPGWEGTFSFA